MDEYIKKADVLNASKLVYIECLYLDEEGYEEAEADDIRIVFARDIESIPAADVEEVRHGHWIITEYEYYDCSECGKSYFNGCDSLAEAERRLEIHQDVYDRCPYCGAKMDGKRGK